jgi:hypothetical protein
VGQPSPVLGLAPTPCPLQNCGPTAQIWRTLS